MPSHSENGPRGATRRFRIWETSYSLDRPRPKTSRLIESASGSRRTTSLPTIIQAPRQEEPVRSMGRPLEWNLFNVARLRETSDCIELCMQIRKNDLQLLVGKAFYQLEEVLHG